MSVNKLGKIKVMVKGKDATAAAWAGLRAKAKRHVLDEKNVLVLIHVLGYQDSQARKILGLPVRGFRSVLR